MLTKDFCFCCSFDIHNRSNQEIPMVSKLGVLGTCKWGYEGIKTYLASQTIVHVQAKAKEEARPTTLLEKNIIVLQSTYIGSTLGRFSDLLLEWGKIHPILKVALCDVALATDSLRDLSVKIHKYGTLDPRVLSYSQTLEVASDILGLLTLVPKNVLDKVSKDLSVKLKITSEKLTLICVGVTAGKLIITYGPGVVQGVRTGIDRVREAIRNRLDPIVS